MINSHILALNTSPFLLASSGLGTFVQAYVDSDIIGKLIFILLIGLSFISWTLLIYKWWVTSRVQEESYLFKRAFIEQKHHPLAISFTAATHPETPNAFSMIYSTLRTKALEFMEQNKEVEEMSLYDTKGDERALKKSHSHEQSGLVISDFSILEAQAASMIAAITKYLERNLYILSTVATLAPFLGLLGTVYGILVTFAELSPESSTGSTNQILSGLSLALTTTVIGLINAIPALIGYNAIKNKISDFDHEMGRFATEVISTFDAHYRIRESRIRHHAGIYPLPPADTMRRVKQQEI